MTLGQLITTLLGFQETHDVRGDTEILFRINDETCDISEVTFSVSADRTGSWVRVVELT